MGDIRWAPAFARHSAPRFGLVYLGASPYSEGLYKVGWSTNLARRARDVDIRVLHVVATNYAGQLEQQVKLVLAPFQAPQNGPAGSEWFMLPEDVVSWFLGLPARLQHGLRQCDLENVARVGGHPYRIAHP